MGILEIVFNSRKFDLNDDVLMGFDNYFDKKSKDYNSFCLDEEDINPLQNFVAQIKSADSDSVIYVSTYGYEIMATKKKITEDWQQLFPELKKIKLLDLDNRLGPLITGIYLKVVRNTYYTPVAYVHNLCREYSSITTSLECTSETIALEKHEERYMFSAERLNNKLLIPLKGDVSIDKIIEGYKFFLSIFRRKSFEEYKDIALVCGWYGEKKILDDILEYIWNNVQKDKNHPFFRNKDRGVEGWFEKIREESSDCERLHEICEKEIQKHKVGKLPYRNII